MSTGEALKGLSCPRCGGMVPIPEGQALVICPYCDLRSVVRGERGVRRYQVPQQTDSAQAENAFRGFLKGKIAIARGVAREAQISELFLVHLPFWAAWGRALGWAFGQKRVGSGDNKRYEPREVRVAEDMSWNGAACDVGEFGVNQINLSGRPLEPFDAGKLHASGMVFEPVGSAQDALATAEREFDARVCEQSRLDRIAQTFVRIVRPRLGLVYYPLWVARYLYRGRSFQVVVDGFSGEVLYGKAPGNVFFRAGVLVGGMMGGSFLAVTVPGLILSGSSNGDDSLGIAAFCFFAGLALMYGSWRKYRYGEHYEYRRYKSRQESFLNVLSSTDNVFEMVRSLEKLR